LRAKWRTSLKLAWRGVATRARSLGHTPKPCIGAVLQSRGYGPSTCSDRLRIEARSRKRRRQRWPRDNGQALHYHPPQRRAQDPFLAMNVAALVRGAFHPSACLPLPERARLRSANLLRRATADPGLRRTPPITGKIGIGVHAHSPRNVSTYAAPLAALLDPLLPARRPALTLSRGYVCGPTISGLRPEARRTPAAKSASRNYGRRSRKRQQVRDQATLESRSAMPSRLCRRRLLDEPA